MPVLTPKLPSQLLTPTAEQAAIINESKTSTDNLLVSALAGAAKTSTLEMIAVALSNIPILSIAFNKRIADEMKLKLPSNVKAQTINSVGAGVWAAFVGKKSLAVDKGKSYGILKLLVDSLHRSLLEGAYEDFSNMLQTIRAAKVNGYIPPMSFGAKNSLMTEEEFFSRIEDTPSDLHIRLVNDTLMKTIQQGYAGTIDFDDQIYLPTLFGGTFPTFPLVMVDEAQDLSPLNHIMLRKLVVKRLIAVGDALQSIYAFRGALSNSMDALRETFKMRELGLSISFRCPQRVVEAARFRAPHMQWAPGAKLGEVQTLPHWRASDIPDGAAIVCRNNAPLMSCALKLIQAGRGVKLVGTELGPQLVKALKRLGPEDMTQQQVFEAIDNWERERLLKTRNASLAHDKADCLRVFAAFGDSLGAAIAYAEHIFAAAGPVQLLTIHKAKGLEWSTVYFLEPDLIPSQYAITQEEFTQELNARYVAITRAKENLYMVNLKDLGE